MDQLQILRALPGQTAFKVALVTLERSSSQTIKAMGENKITFSFKSKVYIDFRINDYCFCFGERYILNKKPSYKKLSRYNYEYLVQMDFEGVTLSYVQMRLAGSTSSFSYTGTASNWIDLLLTNANAVAPTWYKGQVIPSSPKTITFEKENCYNVLVKLAEVFETEFTIDGRVIHLTKRSIDSGNTYVLGRYQGLYDIKSDPVEDRPVITRIYAEGSTKNLPPEYRNFDTQRLQMPPGVDYIEQDTAKYGIRETTIFFEDIYPHRTGRVTSVNAGNPFKFIDGTMNFNVNDQLLPGIGAKVIFNTGDLIGYSFEINSYNNATKEFTLLKNKEETAVDIPSSLLKPRIGDEYVIVDIKMPQSYIDVAEAELMVAATQYLTDTQNMDRLTVSFDPIDLRRKNRVPQIFELIWIKDNDLGINRQIRITNLVRSLTNEYEITCDLTDTISTNTIQKINNNLNTVNAQQKENQITVNQIFNNYVGDLPEISDLTGAFQLYVKDGKLYKKI